MPRRPARPVPLGRACLGRLLLLLTGLAASLASHSLPSLSLSLSLTPTLSLTLSLSVLTLLRTRQFGFLLSIYYLGVWVACGLTVWKALGEQHMQHTLHSQHSAGLALPRARMLACACVGDDPAAAVARLLRLQASGKRQDATAAEAARNACVGARRAVQRTLELAAERVAGLVQAGCGASALRACWPSVRRGGARVAC